MYAKPKCILPRLGIGSYLPRLVEDLDEGERHRDEAEHQVRDGEVHDEDVPRRPHGRVAHHHEDDEEVAHAAHEDHGGVEDDDEGVGDVADAGLGDGRTRTVSNVFPNPNIQAVNLFRKPVSNRKIFHISNNFVTKMPETKNQFDANFVSNSRCFRPSVPGIAIPPPESGRSSP